MAGAIADAHLRQNTLQTRLARAERQVSALTAALSGSANALATSQASIAALDATLRMAYPSVNPAAAGTVKAWAGKYGKRGGLTEFLLQTLKDAAPTPVTTTVLINFAASHFGLVFQTPEDRERFRFPVRSTMRRLVKSGIVELLPSSSPMGAAAWRIKQAPTFADLLVHTRAIALAGANDGDRNSRSTEPDPS